MIILIFLKNYEIQFYLFFKFWGSKTKNYIIKRFCCVAVLWNSFLSKIEE